MIAADDGPPDERDLREAIRKLDREISASIERSLEDCFEMKMPDIIKNKNYIRSFLVFQSNEDCSSNALFVAANRWEPDFRLKVLASDWAQNGRTRKIREAGAGALTVLYRRTGDDICLRTLVSVCTDERQPEGVRRTAAFHLSVCVPGLYEIIDLESLVSGRYTRAEVEQLIFAK
jgi:hypothetical protein